MQSRYRFRTVPAFFGGVSPLKKEHKHTFSEFMVIIPKESFHIRLLSIFLVASLQKGIKICSLLFSILLLIHTAQFTRLLRSKRIGLLYPCYTPTHTLFIVAAFNAALVSFLVPHTMRLFFVFRREAIKAHRECPVEIRWSKCAARVSEKHRTP